MQSTDWWICKSRIAVFGSKENWQRSLVCGLKLWKGELLDPIESCEWPSNMETIKDIFLARHVLKMNSHLMVVAMKTPCTPCSGIDAIYTIRFFIWTLSVLDDRESGKERDSVREEKEFMRRISLNSCLWGLFPVDGCEWLPSAALNNACARPFLPSYVG